MSDETHPVGDGAESTLALAPALPVRPECDASCGAMHADFGVDGDGASDLWKVASGLFRPRACGSQICPDCVEPAMVGLSSIGVTLTGGSHRGY